MGPVPGAPSGGGAAFTESSLRAMFLALDTSGDGFLSYRELWDGLSGSDVDWDASYDKRIVLDRLWKVADADGNDRVTFPEFWLMVAATRSPRLRRARTAPSERPGTWSGRGSGTAPSRPKVARLRAATTTTTTTTFGRTSNDLRTTTRGA